MDPDADINSLEAPQRVAVGILGPGCIAYMIEIYLTGLCCSAFYQYLVRGRFSRDSLRMRAVTFTVFTLNCAVAVMAGYETFKYEVTQDRTRDEMWLEDPVGSALPFTGGLAALITQGYFCRRAALLFENSLYRWTFVSVVGFFMVVAFSGAVGVSVFDYIYYAGGLPSNISWRSTSLLWFSASAFVDVLNSTTLCYLLMKKVAGFNNRTDSVLRRVCLLSVETASYTAVDAVAAAICLGTSNLSSWHFAAEASYMFWVPLPALYGLSLLTTLGSRDRMAQELTCNPVICDNKLESGYVSPRNSFLSPGSRPLSPSSTGTRPLSGLSMSKVDSLSSNFGRNQLTRTPTINVTSINVQVETAIAEERVEEDSWRVPKNRTFGGLATYVDYHGGAYDSFV